MSAPQFMALCDQRFVSCFCAKWTYSHQVLLGVLFSGAQEGKQASHSKEASPGPLAQPLLSGNYALGQPGLGLGERS